MAILNFWYFFENQLRYLWAFFTFCWLLMFWVGITLILFFTFNFENCALTSLLLWFNRIWWIIKTEALFFYLVIICESNSKIVNIWININGSFWIIWFIKYIVFISFFSYIIQIELMHKLYFCLLLFYLNMKSIFGTILDVVKAEDLFICHAYKQMLVLKALFFNWGVDFVSETHFG